MTIYRIRDTKQIEEYFELVPEEDKPWNEWSDDPMNEFNGGPEDLVLFIEFDPVEEYAAWSMEDSDWSAPSGIQLFTEDDYASVAGFLERHGILNNPEFAVCCLPGK